MKDLDRSELSHFHAIRNSTSFATFEKWLKASLTEERELSDRTKDLTELRQGQGYRMALADILFILGSVDTEIENYNRNNN